MPKEPMSKRDLILSTAKLLFIEKGFRGTTVANIAQQAGIAKGSVYSHFSSKLDIVKALFLLSDEKNHHLVAQLLENNEKQGLELLEEYLMSEFQEVLNERSFIQAFLADDAILMDQEIMTVVQECRINYHASQRKVLQQAYGEEIKPWLYDIVAMVNGLLGEYSVYLTLDDANFSIKRCAHLVSFCLDSAIKSLSSSTLTPLMTRENCPLIQHSDTQDRQQEKTIALLEAIKQEARELDSAALLLVEQTVTLIEAELTASELNTTLVRALIANLRPYTTLSPLRRRLADLLDVELI